MNVEKIFIVHWKELRDRKEYLDNVLPNDKVFWVDMYDRNTITEGEISECYSFNNEDVWYSRQKDLYKNVSKYRDLKLSEICNAKSHIYCLDHIIENNIDVSLILEDDVRFNNIDNFDNLLGLTPEDFDIIFLGSSYSIKILDNVGCETTSVAKLISPGIYEKVRNPKTRTVDSYIIKFETAKKLRSIIDKISLPYDFDLAFFIKQLDLKVYWWEPGLTYQGSMSGAYSSSIR